MSLQEKADWFNNNFNPVLKSGSIDCYSCVFRGLRPYCIKMSCWYLDDCKLYSFCWTSTYNLIHNPLPKEVKEFFDNNSREDIKDLSRESLFSALVKKSINNKERK